MILLNIDDIINCDFDTVHEAGIRLREILNRDFENRPIADKVLDIGAEDYVIRAVIEALFKPQPAAEQMKLPEV